MKFAIVVVMLALALGAQSSVLPWGHLGLGLGHGLSYSSVHAPALLPAAVPLGHYGAHLGHYGAHLGLAHGPVLAHGPALAHGPVLAHGPALVHGPALAHHASVAHHAGLVPGASYVAKTRGAVHTAPLAGHLNSAASINVLPAPGTI